jgi:hypothetical protein
MKNYSSQAFQKVIPASGKKMHAVARRESIPARKAKPVVKSLKDAQTVVAMIMLRRVPSNFHMHICMAAVYR